MQGENKKNTLLDVFPEYDLFLTLHCLTCLGFVSEVCMCAPAKGVKRSLRSPLLKYLQGQGATETFIQTQKSKC